MTNDELEAVRARAAKAKAAEWDKQWGDFHVAVAKSQADIPALLDEVERLGKLFVDTRGRGHWLTEEEHARATRAEAHAALLQTEATYWHDKHKQDRLALADSEAHAERLAGALELMADKAVEDAGCNPSQAWWDALVDARSALSAYRSAKDEACSRPSDALDAPVEPTSSHLGNGADQ